MVVTWCESVVPPSGTKAFQKAQGAGAKMEGYAARAASSRPVGGTQGDGKGYGKGYGNDATNRMMACLGKIWVCLKMLAKPLNPMVLLIIIPIKWL